MRLERLTIAVRSPTDEQTVGKRISKVSYLQRTISRERSSFYKLINKFSTRELKRKIEIPTL